MPSLPHNFLAKTKHRLRSAALRATTYIRNHKFSSAITLILLIAYIFCLPRQLFHEPYSTVVLSSDGQLLGAKIATDGQWRFPTADSVLNKFAQCIVQFEDAHFYHHFGFNPIAMVAAARQNSKAGRVVRGGSTLTQQVIRLARDGKRRSYLEKMKETILATRLEFRYSKKKILLLYATHAPFGGNVVGLDMAAYRYFGVKPDQLSWAESATLAVLPNAPSLIYPGKNSPRLRSKRDALLKKLLAKNIIDQTSFDLATAEPLPTKPFDLPQLAPHLVQRIAKGKNQMFRSTIDRGLQERVLQLANFHYRQNLDNDINNLAVLVIDVKTRNVLAYVGNAPTDVRHHKDVDIITAPRSTGSILKPFLYAAMLDEGSLLPNALVADIPTQISGYVPVNYNLTFDGAVPASAALSRSLNIPAVLELRDYGIPKFYDLLQKFKLRDINQHPDHYGLSLILGGAESNLWDLCRTFSGMASTLNHFTSDNGKYRSNEYVELNLNATEKRDFGIKSFDKPSLGAGAIWSTFNAMKEVNRPTGDEAWKFYESSLTISWKTGTSFGNRDAWAIGVSPRYVVGVWFGNASGEGRPALTGVGAAAPLMFDVFGILPRSENFPKPLNDLEEVEVCEQSGYLAPTICPKKEELVPRRGVSSKTCPYHKLVHLDSSEKFRVNSSCANVDAMKNEPWFILPPVMEFYYRNLHADYRALPPWLYDCETDAAKSMDFIYPKNDMVIYPTKDYNGTVQPIIFTVATTSRDAELYWYIDRNYQGMTKTFHEMRLLPTSGKHIVLVIDSDGNEIRRNVEIRR